MEELNIPFGGLARVPSALDAEDGSLAVSHNLIYERGALRPLILPEPSFTLGEGEELACVHNVEGRKNYFSRSGNTLQAFWINGIERKNYWDTPAETGGSILSITSIGNTVVALTDNGMQHFLWKDGTYKHLGGELPEVVMSFGLLGYPILRSMMENDNGEKLSTFSISFDSIKDGDIRKEFSDENKQRISEQVLAKVNEFIQKAARDKGRFLYPFFVRYALRLFDGTLAHHSPPVLMIPASGCNPVVLWDRIKEKKDEYTSAKDLDIFAIPCEMDYGLMHNQASLDALREWSDIVKSIDIFISEPIYTYDQNGLCTTFFDPDNFQPFMVGRINDGSGMSDKHATILNGQLYYYYQKWTFKQVYSSFHENSYPSDTIALPETEADTLDGKIRGCSLFYLLKSIPLDELEAWKESSLNDVGRKAIEIEEGYLDTLALKERMADDYLSHDQLLPQYAHVYNQRLNLADVRRRLFRGFNPLAACCFANGSYSYTYTKYTEPDANGNEGRFNFHENVGDMFTVAIRTMVNEGMSGIAVESDVSSITGQERNLQFPRSAFGYYLYYPNPKATRMTAKFMSQTAPVLEPYMNLVLEEHTGLNGAFWFGGFSLEAYSGTASVGESSADPVADDSNKLWTSEAGNPFRFPLGGVNTVGTGRILGVSSTTRALSQGQFGQFPLLVFATDGVWAMEVGGDGLYTARQPVSRDVCCNAASITQTDGAVVFAAERGLLVITGSDTAVLSAALDGPAFSPADLDGFRDVLRDEGFLEEVEGAGGTEAFFRTCRVAYDYANARLLLFRRGGAHAWACSLESGGWATLSSAAILCVADYPDCLLQDADGAVRVLSEKENPGSAARRTKALIVTRPLKLGDLSLKTVNAIALRGNMRLEGCAAILYASRDGLRYVPVGSSRGLRVSRMQGSPWRFFRLAVVKGMEAWESISMASVALTRKWRNKLR